MLTCSRTSVRAARQASSVLCHTGADPLGPGRLVSEARGKALSSHGG